MKKDKKKPLVMAEIIFLSAKGEDPVPAELTSENIIRYLPDTSTVSKVVDFFGRNEIEVTYYQGISATLIGKKSKVEKLFGVDLKLINGKYRLKKAESDHLLPTEKLPDEISTLISVITFPEEVEPFH